MCDIGSMCAFVKRHSSFLGYGACALAGCLWGTGFFFGKIALTEVDVNHMVLYRFLFACLSLLPILGWHRSEFAPSRTQFTGKEWRKLFLASFLGIPVQFLIQFHGLSLTTVSHAALMVGTMPVILAAGATLFAGERLDKIGWGALVASSIGAALIVTGGHHAQRQGTNGPSLLGDLLVVISLAIALAWILINKQLMEKHPPMVVTTYGLLSGTLMLTIIVLLFNGLPPIHSVSPKVWIALASSGALCTAITTLLWNWGLHHVPASRAGVFLNLEPALGSYLGVKLLGEKLGPYAGAGGILILGAAILLTTRKNREQPTA